MHNAKNAKVNKEWLLLRNELRERACKEASSAVQWSGVEEVVAVVVAGGGGGLPQLALHRLQGRVTSTAGHDVHKQTR